MEPFITLVAVTLIARFARRGARAGVRRDWPEALRLGLAAMFTLTGVAHFVGMREELVAMVPDSLPAPGALVTVTGVLELLGVAGLLLTRRVPWSASSAAWGLTALLVAMFPANVHLALSGGATSWTQELLPRTVLQVVFLAAALVVAVRLRPATILGNPTSPTNVDPKSPRPVLPRDAADTI